MKIVNVETFIVSIPYKHSEISSRVNRDGVTNVIVRLTADNGLIGWGESCSGANVESIEQAVQAAKPFLLRRDPWNSEGIAQDYFKRGLWDYRPMTGNFAFAGIDQALWDLCGKECGQPLYRLFGGALREQVNYFYYLSRGTDEELIWQCQDGIEKGYSCFYLKVGIDSEQEARMLSVIRRCIGSAGKIRIDANEAWSVAEAVRLLHKWDEHFAIDFCEAPVRADPVSLMRETKGKLRVPICANEGLGRVEDVLRMIEGNGADILCFSAYWVGTMRRFHSLCHMANWHGIGVVKHTHGETGIAAAAMHHMMISIPNAIDGSQQTAQVMEGDLLKGSIPIADGPHWSAIDRPGLGIEVDEERLGYYHKNYLKVGQYLPFQIKSD